MTAKTSNPPKAVKALISQTTDIPSDRARYLLGEGYATLAETRLGLLRSKGVDYLLLSIDKAKLLGKISSEDALELIKDLNLRKINSKPNIWRK